MFAPTLAHPAEDAPAEDAPADLIERIDAAHARVGAAHLQLLELIAQVDATGAWEHDGARDAAHWLAMRYGISTWKAHRMIGAAHALDSLPRTAAALGSGELSLEKTLELVRFAAPDTEARLIRWARRVATWAVRARADRERAAEQQVARVHAERSLQWWYEGQEGRMALSAHLPADQGAVVVAAIEHAARALPTLPADDPDPTAPERAADALVALCSARLGAEPDPDRATLVVHVRAADLLGPVTASSAGGQVESGPALHPDSVRRLACDARIQTVLEGRGEAVLAVRAMRREPPAWMLRQLRWRDPGCRFPGCGARAFTQAHHLVLWSRGGTTELSNLVLICSWHHRLVHELGWSVRREPGGELIWMRPGGVRYRAGPAPCNE